MTGEHGLPCGKELFKQDIFAITVAISLCSKKLLFFIKKPRTLPKLKLPKKLLKSILSTFFLLI